ncbi:MAG: protein kinase [Acidobacteria bacterium]|nr:protein kinase [Acidobacteriota bacterium]
MIGRTLAHYRITAAIGAGGMGEVYRAHDSRLKRDVALKVLPAEMASSPERLERFRREAQALAALDHPGIVTVYSVEEADGVHFLTMQLVEGQSLDRVVPASGLTPPQVIEIAMAVAEALAAAHEKGIVHRDLKPANVMLTGDGRVKVLDFGLAKVLSGTQGAAAASDATYTSAGQTAIGAVMGTPAYMSPEQVAGRAVDHRSDVFSFGALLYEMATGRRPFEGASSAELASAILRDAPPPLEQSRSDIPEGLRRVIARCLEKKPEDRFRTVREAAEVLNSLRSGSAPIALMAPATSAAVTPAPSTGARRRDEGFWIGVLPFACRGSDAGVEALAEGLTEDVVTGLARFSYLRVIARGSTAQYASGSADVRAIGNEIGARYVMEGSLRQAGPQVRVAVQLVDTTTGAHLWAETYNRPFDPNAVFALQDDLVPRIVSTCADHFGVLARAISEAIRGKPLDELTPYEALMRGFGYHFRLNAEEHADAREVLERVVREAPANADCWAMLSWVYSHEHAHGFNPRPGSLDRALAAARRAVDLASANHVAQQALAVALFFGNDRAGCLAAAERAMALNPLDGSNEAFFLITFTGDWERGTSLIRRAIEMNPHHPRWYELILAINDYRAERYREAVDEVRRANLGHGPWTSPILAAACAQLGDRLGAGEALRGLPGDPGDLARSTRTLFEKWFEPRLVEHLMDGLRKAGLDVDPPAGTGTPEAVGRGARPTPTTSSPSLARDAASVAIAVLPFSDMSPAKDQDYLCEGMAEEIRNALVRVAGIRVASRTSAFRASQEEKDLAALGRLLSVDHVLEGSIRTAGSRLRVTAQLSEVTSGYHVWSERFDREMQDVFVVQDEIADGVVQAVKARLAPGVRSAQARPQPRNLEAYRSYLLGQHLRYAKEDHGGAVRAFREAVRLDPDHAPSWTGLAESLVLSAYAGLMPAAEACAEARTALATAVDLQGQSADGLHGEAFVAMIERRWVDLESTVRRAVAFEPTHVPSLGLLGMCLSLHQRPDEAEPFFERARAADPLASFPYMLTSLGLLSVGRVRDAHHYAEQALIFEKDDFTALTCSSLANVALGSFEQGIAAAEHAVSLSHGGAHFVGLLGWALATAGRKDEARALLDQLRAQPAGTPVVVSQGWLLGALGDIDAALEVFGSAEREHQAWLLHYRLPGFAPCQDDERFKALVRKMGLPAPPERVDA